MRERISFYFAIDNFSNRDQMKSIKLILSCIGTLIILMTSPEYDNGKVIS